MRNLPTPRNGLRTASAEVAIDAALRALRLRVAQLQTSLGPRPPSPCPPHSPCQSRSRALSSHLRLLQARTDRLAVWLGDPQAAPADWRAYVQDALDLAGVHSLPKNPILTSR